MPSPASCRSLAPASPADALITCNESSGSPRVRQHFEAQCVHPLIRVPIAHWDDPASDLASSAKPAAASFENPPDGDRPWTPLSGDRPVKSQLTRPVIFLTFPG